MTIWPRDARRMWQRLARDDERRAEVDVELQGDPLRLLVGERAADADAGRVDEDVHPAVALGMGRDDADALVRVAEVGGHGERAELGCGRLERLGPSRGERERRTRPRAARARSQARSPRTLR